MARFRAPTGNGEVLAVPGFADVPRLVEGNRRKLDRTDVVIGGLPLRELRALARREAMEGGIGAKLPAGGTEAPLLLTGHQPELAHPGEWVKNFALNGLAKRLGGTPLNLIVDNDTLKIASLRFPVLHPPGPKAHLESLPFDTFAGEVPYEDRVVRDEGLFRTFPERAAHLWTNLGYEPLLARVWKFAGNIGDAFTAMRRRCEHDWGCRNAELHVSRLSLTDAFARFATHIFGDLPRFRRLYNAAIRAYREANGVRSENHPAPELAEGEAPFWVRTTTGRRERATPASDVRTLRPRALTLTLFARVCLGDFFIHGIGGGKYDEVTDALIRDYFGIDPPAYQVLSATLHLPLPGFPSTPDDFRAAERRVRDLHWNPQRHLSPGVTTELLAGKAALIAAEPPVGERAARRAWFRELQAITEELRPFVRKQVPVAKANLARVRAEVAANEVLRRRDYSWVLYPEEVLRPFLRRFLDV